MMRTPFCSQCMIGPNIDRDRPKQIEIIWEIPMASNPNNEISPLQLDPFSISDETGGANISLINLLQGARKRLVETGTRNRLIHVNRLAKRANAINIVNERADDVFDILRSNGRKMKFLATGDENDGEAEDPDGISFATEDNLPFDDARYTDSYLETPLNQDNLQKRLLKMARDARTAEEEQGVNILYLAIGFLSWFEDAKSQIKREAPLILLPVELVRNERTSTYDVKCRDDDIVTNLPLHERLKGDFGIVLSEIDDSEAWSPSAYFALVCEAVSGQPRWNIDKDGMQLGFFSFSKLLMLRDLDPGNWPEGALIENNLIRGLLRDGFAAEAPLFPGNARLDEHLEPSDILHVVDADASQAKVVQEVRTGRNLVVQGPPGTGKSQTITNILAAAVHDGKSVLFVAEKMAALSVVHNRMVKVGLSDACLELHSRSANKKAFLHEIARTLSSGRSVPSVPGEPNRLKDSRDALNEIASVLHSPVDGRDFTPFEVISEMIDMIGRNVPPPRLSAVNLNALTNANRNDLIRLVKELRDSLAPVGDKVEHPFYGANNWRLQPTDLLRLVDEIRQAVAAIDQLNQKLAGACEQSGLPQPRSLLDARNLASLLVHSVEAPGETGEQLEILYSLTKDQRFHEGLKSASDWQMTRSELSDNFAEAAWSHSVMPLRAHIAKGVGSFFSRLFGRYRSASAELETILRSPLPGRPNERLVLVDRLIEAQSKKRLFEDDEAYLKDHLGTNWRGERTDFSSLLEASEWIEHTRSILNEITFDQVCRSRSAVAAGKVSGDPINNLITVVEQKAPIPLDRLTVTDAMAKDLASADLTELRNRLDQMSLEIGRYAEWARLKLCEEPVHQAGLGGLIDLLETGEISPDTALDEFRYAIAEARWNMVRASIPYLDEIAGTDRHELVKVFRELDRHRIDEVQRLIRAKHLSQLPTGAVGEMGFILGEIAKKRRHRPIRKVMEVAGGMVQRIKPVFLMSPISVAQYLPPGVIEFDILVFDEASQVRPEEALGAIARARQIVVVGDQKQLPPTSFFDRLADDQQEEEDEDQDSAPATAKAVEMESVLSLCEARGLKQSMLEWHYRSRDPSLISVSNKEFYDDRLILPPSPTQIDDRFGLTFTRVPGVYSSTSRGGGRPGTNRIEAEAIVDAIKRLARESPDFSVGVVTFSKSQADMLTEVLELARRRDEILDAFLREGKSESVFVKNIENVQGDERDVILISVGYGPHEPNGRLSSMRFGPINTDGGERRLNVLFSRARIRCEVFASFDPSDMDLSRTKASGPRILKRFLEYARSGELGEKAPTGDEADSPFETDVARAIESLGFKADHQIGSAGFKVDLGVRTPERPGQYILAVECDGATYHSALWARERDRLRQDVLESFGWKFHRIWSTDWFYRRDNEIERLRIALETARATSETGQTITGSNSAWRMPVEESSDGDLPSDIQLIEFEPTELSVPKYRQANLVVRSGHEPHELPLNQMVDLAAAVVTVEGPIHGAEVARRIAGAFGKARTGSRIQDAVQRGLRAAKRQDLIDSDSDFWFTDDQVRDVPIRDRSDESGTTIKAESLSDMEIQAAARLIEQESGKLEPDEMVRSIVRLMGFRRAGPDFQKRISIALSRAPAGQKPNPAVED